MARQPEGAFHRSQMLKRWKKVQLQGKCQLAALPSVGVTWEKQMTTVCGIGDEQRDEKVEYRYDGEDYPLGKTTIKSDKTLSVTAKPSVTP